MPVRLAQVQLSLCLTMRCFHSWLQLYYLCPYKKYKLHPQAPSPFQLVRVPFAWVVLNVKMWILIVLVHIWLRLSCVLHFHNSGLSSRALKCRYQESPSWQQWHIFFFVQHLVHIISCLQPCPSLTTFQMLPPTLCVQLLINKFSV